MLKGSVDQNDKIIINTTAKPTQTHRTKPDRIEGRNRQFNSNSWRLQYPLDNWQND